MMKLRMAAPAPPLSVDDGAASLVTEISQLLHRQ
jgi:hypothetical protein